MTFVIACLAAAFVIAAAILAAVAMLIDRMDRAAEQTQDELYDKPVLYWPADADCRACSPEDYGMCTCLKDCGHLCCTGASRDPEHPSPAIPEPDDEMVIRLATLVFCPLCHPGGHGRCICVAYCGDGRCTYDHTTVSMLTAADQAWLRQHGVTEQTDQEGSEL